MNKKINFLINAFYYAFIGVLLFLALKYLLGWFMPFIIAFLIATLAYSIVGKISNGKINEKLSSTLLVILIYFILGALLIMAVSGIILTVDKFSGKFPQIYSNTLVPAFESVAGWVDKVISKISPEFVHLSDMTLNEFMTRFEDIITLVSEKSIVFAGGLIKSIPSIFTAFIITIISSVLISLNYKRTTAFLREHLPKKVTEIIGHTKRFVTTSVFKMFKAYAIIMLITFLELLIGFFILKIKNPVLIALVVSLVDLLPLIGLGVVIIPWIAVALIQKNFFLGVGLSVMFLVITVIRNVIEPKIVGGQIGLSPIVSLIAVYVGFKAMGVLGLFLAPIIVIVIRDLYKSGLIKF